MKPVTYMSMWLKDKVRLYFLIKCPGHIKIFKHALDLKPGQLFLFSHLKVLFPIRQSVSFLCYSFEKYQFLLHYFIWKTSDLPKRSGKKNECTTIKKKNKNKMNCALLLLYMDHLSNYMLGMWDYFNFPQ